MEQTLEQIQLRPGKAARLIAEELTHPSQELFLYGSVRASKSVHSLILWLARLRDSPPGFSHLLAGRTERTIYRNIIQPYLYQLVPKDQMVERRGDGYLLLYGRVVWLVGCSDIRAVEKIQGMTLMSAYGDEVTTWPEECYTMILTRLSLPGARFVGTGNTEHPLHWAKSRIVDGDTARSVRFHIDDNQYLDPEFVVRLKKQMRAAGAAYYARYIEGEWVNAEGRVFPHEDHHLSDGPPGWVTGGQVKEWVVGVDHGTASPTVAVLLAVGADDIWVVDEWRWDPTRVGSELTDFEQSKRITRWIEDGPAHRPMVYVDPSAASLYHQMRQHGLDVHHADNDLVGLRVVASLLGEMRLRFVEPRVLGLLSEMSAYVWDETPGPDGDRPVKTHDHGCDALRYALMGLWKWWSDWLLFGPV